LNAAKDREGFLIFDIMKNIAIVLFDRVEVLDFAGPFEVFSVCGAHGEHKAPLTFIR